MCTAEKPGGFYACLKDTEESKEDAFNGSDEKRFFESLIYSFLQALGKLIFKMEVVKFCSRAMKTAACCSFEMAAKNAAKSAAINTVNLFENEKEGFFENFRPPVFPIYHCYSMRLNLNM